MVVSVVLSGLPQYVTLQDLGSNLDKVFDTDYIKTFHIRDLPDHPTTGKRRVALDFKSGFDGAMEAQSLLDGYKYSLDNGKTYTLKAKVNHDPALSRTDNFDDHTYEACLVEYRDMAHGRILDMHLDSLKKQREVIRSERKLLKEKRKLNKEKRELNESEDSSDSEKRHAKRHKKRDKKKQKKKRKYDRRASDSLSSSEGQGSSDRSEGWSRSPDLRRKRKSPSIEEFRPRTDSSLRARLGLGGSALVPYTHTQSPRPRPRSPPPTPTVPALRSPSPRSATRSVRRGYPSSESPTRRERSRSRRSDSPPAPPRRRGSTRRSPEAGRRRRSPPGSASGRRPPARRSHSVSPPAKRHRVSATATVTHADRERGYRWSSPSPPRSYRRSESGSVRSDYSYRGDMASTSRGERERERPRERERQRQRPHSYIGDDDFNTIGELLESVKKDDSTDGSSSPTVNINLNMKVVKKSNKLGEKDHTEKTKKPKKKMPMPIKQESDEERHKATSAFPKETKDCMPKPLIDQKSLNIKKERREVPDEDIEDGEIHEIDENDDDEASESPQFQPAVDYANEPWVPITPDKTPPQLPKIIPPHPRFVLPITKIMNSMKKYYSSVSTTSQQYRLKTVLKDLLLTRLKVMLKNEKGYKCTKEILVMYREHHPIELDEQFVEETLKEINEGMYDVWIHDQDPILVQVKQEDCKENIRPVIQQNGAGAGDDASGQWVPFKPVVEPDDDILILEPAKPTLDLTENDDNLNTPDIDKNANLSDASEVVQQKIKIDSSEPFSFLQDTISAVKTDASDASDTTVVLGTQSPSIAIADLKMEPIEEADLGIPVSVKQEPDNTNETTTQSAEVGNPTAANTEADQSSHIVADKSSAPSGSQSDVPDVKIKTETEETLDNIAKFVQEAVVKKVIDLTDD